MCSANLSLGACTRVKAKTVEVEKAMVTSTWRAASGFEGVGFESSPNVATKCIGKSYRLCEQWHAHGNNSGTSSSGW